MTPNRVNRAHWPTKEDKQFVCLLLHFSGLWKNVPEIAPNGAGSCFVPANPHLADILGDTDFDFKYVYVLNFFGSQISRFLDFQISGFPD